MDRSKMMNHHAAAFLLIAAIVGLTGCASKPASPVEQKAAETPLICVDVEQCNLYWKRAQFYVNQNSRFKIQLSNESLIQTYSPTGGTTDVGYNISQEPLSDGSVRLWVKIWCDNMFGCYPDTVQEIARFKRYVSGARP